MGDQEVLRLAMLMEVERYDEVREGTASALSRDPQDVVLWRIHADACLSLGLSDEALYAIDVARSLDPQDVRTLCLASDVLRHVGRSQEGAAAARSAVQLAPEDLYAWIALCYTLRACADETDAFVGPRTIRLVKESWRAADRVIEIAPDSAHAYVARSMAMAAGGRAFAARKAFRHALAIDPLDTNAMDALAEANLHPLGLMRAMTLSRSSLTIDPQGRVAKGNVERALHWLLGIFVALSVVLIAVLAMVVGPHLDEAPGPLPRLATALVAMGLSVLPLLWYASRMPQPIRSYSWLWLRSRTGMVLVGTSVVLCLGYAQVVDVATSGTPAAHSLAAPR